MEAQSLLPVTNGAEAGKIKDQKFQPRLAI
jgi:hypothetical protein